MLIILLKLRISCFAFYCFGYYLRNPAGWRARDHEMWILEITLPKELFIPHSPEEKHPRSLLLIHTLRRAYLNAVFVSDGSVIADFA
jgi:hypothetical protein